MFDNNDDYRVGYGRPPKHTQFKKGQSGNPRGRPRRSKNIATLVGRELDERQPVLIGDKQTILTKREIWVKAVVGKAIRGDAKAGAFVMQHQPPEPIQEEKPVDDSAREHNRQQMQQLLDRITERENQKREDRFATRKYLRERGIPEDVINDGFGVLGMEPEEAEQRQARAIAYMRAHGVPEDRIRIVEDRNEDGSPRFPRKLVAPRLDAD